MTRQVAGACTQHAHHSTCFYKKVACRQVSLQGSTLGEGMDEKAVMTCKALRPADTSICTLQQTAVQWKTRSRGTCVRLCVSPLKSGARWAAPSVQLVIPRLVTSYPVSCITILCQAGMCGACSLCCRQKAIKLDRSGTPILQGQWASWQT